MKYIRLGLFALVLTLAGYSKLPVLAASEGPRIERFVSSSSVITSGEAVTLSWHLSGGEPRTLQVTTADQSVPVTGSLLRLEPTLSQVYTLTAQNRLGSEQREQLVQVQTNTSANTSGGAAPEQMGATASGGAVGTASGGNGGGQSEPKGSFGVSLNAGGPFISDEAGGIVSLSDKRVIRVAPGGEFFAEVNYRDPDGIAEVMLNLVNSRPKDLAGTLSPDRPPFSVVGAPTGTCDLGRLPTVVRCLYRTEVSEDAQNISELPGAGDEFAYVFRVRVTDGLGNVASRPVRGYVEVTKGSGN